MLWLCGPILLVDGTLGQLKGNILLNKNKSDKLHFWQTPEDNKITVLSKGISHFINLMKIKFNLNANNF